MLELNNMLMRIINFQTPMRIILIIVYSQIIGFCCAQTFAPVLVNTKWVNEDRGYVRYLEFEKDSLVETIHFSIINKIVSVSKPYYLSDKLTERFDMTKAGKQTSGKYLLLWNKRLSGIEHCEVKTISEDSLTLFFGAKPNHVGAADHYITYKRMKNTSPIPSTEGKRK